MISDVEFEKAEMVYIQTKRQLQVLNASVINNLIRAGQVIFSIVPEEGIGQILARCHLPIARSGKVTRGNRVQIRLESYPYQEYGVLETEVESLGVVPVEVADNTFAYILEFPLPDSLRTTYDKDIPFRQDMRGTAVIITEERRIIERILDKILSIVKNR